MRRTELAPEYVARVTMLTATRRAHFISQYDVAEHLGRTTPWLGEIERLRRIVPPMTLDMIDAALADLVRERQQERKRRGC